MLVIIIPAAAIAVITEECIKTDLTLPIHQMHRFPAHGSGISSSVSIGSPSAVAWVYVLGHYCIYGLFNYAA